MRRRTLLRGGLAATLAALLMSTVGSSQAEELYPGLPERTFGNWNNTPQGALSYAKRAKQWFRSPIGMTVAEGLNIPDPTGVEQEYIRAEAYLVSPKGAPENYGYSEPMTVRSVGFGLMPVEATVQVSQRRENGYPIPTRVRLDYVSEVRPRPPGSGNSQPIQDYIFNESVISDRLNVRLLAVKVDGQDLGLVGECRTVEPALVEIKSPAFRVDDVLRYADEGRDYYEEWFRDNDPSTFYHPWKGGQLSGAMTIPPFTGCTTTAGDDLSDLLTLSVSGPDNPIFVRTGMQCLLEDGSAAMPLPPGASNPRLGTEAGGVTPGTGEPYCPGIVPFDYPERDDH